MASNASIQAENQTRSVAPSTLQQAAANQAGPLPAPAVAAPPTVSSTPAALDAPSKPAIAVWTASLEDKLIDIWGEVYVRLGKGNLALRHWNEITSEVNVSLPEDEVLFTVKQIRCKIDALKAKFKEENNKKTSTGNTNSSWSYFEKMAGYIAGNPKVNGIPNARDCGEPAREILPENGSVEEPNNPVITKADIAIAVGEEDPQIQLSPMSKLMSGNSEGHIKGARNKRKRSNDESSSKGESDIAVSMNKFTEVYADVATKHMDILRELAANKAEMQRQLAKDKAEMDLKILDMQLRFSRNGSN